MNSRNPSGTSNSLASGRIVGIACAVPREIVENRAFRGGIAEEAARITGVAQRRLGAHSSAGLCGYAAMRVLARIGWSPESIDLLIMVTQTPSRMMPGSGYDAHGTLGLSQACRVVDLNAGCAGYIQGLWMAMRALDPGQRALLLVGDTLESVCDPDDRATSPLFGDCGSATAILGAGSAHTFVSGCDSAGNDALSQHLGSTMAMRGPEVFSFTLRTVPLLVEDVLRQSPPPDYLLFHQANRFMLDHLADKMKLAERFPGKFPSNIATFGNCSSASIPLLACDRLRAKLMAGWQQVAMFGYGAGWHWAGVSMPIGNLDCIDIIEV